MGEQVAKGSEHKVPARREDVRDPFLALKKRMERLVDEYSGGAEAWPFSKELTPFDWRMSAFTPNVDIKDEETRITIEAELPGVSEKDVEVTLSGDSLIIRGEKKLETEEKEKDYYRVERSYGSFRRSIPLPVEVDGDNVKATFRNGILSITLPKSKEAL